MRKAILLMAVLTVMGWATSYAVVVHQDNYDNRTIGTNTEGWHWTGGAVTGHAGQYVAWNNGIARQHTGTVNSASGTTGRYGYKTDITMTGNISSNPADYTVEFDVINVSGNWTTLNIGIAVLTYNSVTGTGTYGYNYPTTAVVQGAGVVHVKHNLGNTTGRSNWWQGTGWDMTNPTWSYEINMPDTAVAGGSSFSQVYIIDNLKITMGADTNPYDPMVTPDNGNGTVGTPVNNNTQAEVTFNFKAGGDPNFLRNYPVNPAILGHYIYVSKVNDPNLYLLDYVEQVHNADPMLTSPDNTYGPVTLNPNTIYYWQVEEALDKGTGTPFGAGDPNNILGSIWSFKTTAGQANINPVSPELAVVDAGSSAVLSVTGTNIDTYQWYLMGSPDIQLTNGAKYAGVTTAALTINDVQLADEGYYYCVGSNTMPSQASNRDTGPGRVMIKRLVNYYPMEVVNGTVTPDTVSGADMVLHTNGTVLPALVSDKAVGGMSLSLDPVTETAGQYGQLPAGVLNYKDLTITAWVNWKGNSNGNWQRIFDFGNNTDEYIFLTPVGWDGVTRLVVKDGSEQVAGIEGNLATNQWVHVAVSLSGDTGRLYVNGTLVAKNTAMTYDPITFKPALNYIGKSQWPDAYYNGLIDDMKIYNYPLSNYQIAQEYISVMGGWVCDKEGPEAVLYDFDGNCRVDIGDFAIFATEWLNDNRIY
ncbi:MAG: LamG-like jellyroll fold domain-containing protein [Anaerohalosphaeraceae bacterium]